MARGGKFASIDTFFSLDPYIQKLNANDKWLYFILICNPDISMIGIYEIGLPTLALYSGLDAKAVEDSLDRFATAGKIHYVDGFVVIKQYIKNNPIKGSEKLQIGAQKRIDSLPWFLLERLQNPEDALYIPFLDPKHRVYIGYTEGMDSPPTLSLSLSQSHTQSPSHGPRTSSPRRGAGGLTLDLTNIDD